MALPNWEVVAIQAEVRITRDMLYEAMRPLMLSDTIARTTADQTLLRLVDIVKREEDRGSDDQTQRDDAMV